MCVANGCAVDKSAGAEPFGPLRRAPTLAHERFGLKWRDYFFSPAGCATSVLMRGLRPGSTW
jgi:hypothetical protein